MFSMRPNFQSLPSLNEGAFVVHGPSALLRGLDDCVLRRFAAALVNSSGSLVPRAMVDKTFHHASRSVRERRQPPSIAPGVRQNV
jgi:hypothetical protein